MVGVIYTIAAHNVSDIPLWIVQLTRFVAKYIWHMTTIEPHTAPYSKTKPHACANVRKKGIL